MIRVHPDINDPPKFPRSIFQAIFRLRKKKYPTVTRTHCHIVFLFWKTLPEISHSTQWLNQKITIPCGSEMWLSLPTNVRFCLAAGSAHLFWLAVGRPAALTYSVTYMTKANPPRSMLAIIHHVANMSAMIDGTLPCRISDFCDC